MEKLTSTPRKEPSLVLIANDQEWTARAVESVLVANGYLVQRVFTAAETLERVRLVRPELLILDQQLPDFSGVEVCRRLREDPAIGATLPIIITTAGPSGRDLRLAAYQAGAWDFFGQPLDVETVLHKLQVYEAASREVRLLREALLVDQVSGLYTRAGLVRRTSELLGEARRSGRGVACVVWEVEGFGPETLGVRAGTFFREHGRSGDTIGHLDQHRFVAFAPGTGLDGATRMADRIRDDLIELTEVAGGRVRSRTLVLEPQDDFPLHGGELLDRLDQTIAA